MTDRQSNGLEALVRAAGEGSGARPVESWDPPYCGDIGLAILRDGTWVYQNSPIGRPALVKLFASILRKDADGRTYLVTPVEMVDVRVEDAPFLAVEMAVSSSGTNQVLTFRTTADDVVVVGPEHPLRFCRQVLDGGRGGGLKPYILVRGRLEALVTRAVYADLAELACPRDDDAGRLGVWSGGTWWEMG